MKSSRKKKYWKNPLSHIPFSPFLIRSSIYSLPFSLPLSLSPFFFILLYLHDSPVFSLSLFSSLLPCLSLLYQFTLYLSYLLSFSFSSLAHLSYLLLFNPFQSVLPTRLSSFPLVLLCLISLFRIFISLSYSSPSSSFLPRCSSSLLRDVPSCPPRPWSSLLSAVHKPRLSTHTRAPT